MASQPRADGAVLAIRRAMADVVPLRRQHDVGVLRQCALAFVRL